jgi:hypothetical protein
MAPQPPPWWDQLWHDTTSVWDDIVHVASSFVHDKALLEFISGVCNLIATVAAVLALFPPLSAIFGPVALIAALAALSADALLALFDHGSWSAVLLDALAVATDSGWMRAAGKLADLYKVAGLEKVMAKAPTWAGVISKIPMVGEKAIGDAKTFVPVAPGMFRMIGDALKGSDATAKEIAAIKDFAGYSTWRAVDIVCGQASWAFSTAGIEAIPNNIRTWINDGCGSLGVSC